MSHTWEQRADYMREQRDTEMERADKLEAEVERLREELKYAHMDLREKDKAIARAVARAEDEAMGYD